MIILSTSSQYFRVQVSAQISTGALNVSADPVAFAFLPNNTEPTSSTVFTTGSWESTSTPYVAQCLIGPLGLVLPIGSYIAYVKVTSNPEVPILAAGLLVIQ